MNIISIDFVLFMLLTIAVYYSIPRKWQWELLLVTGLLFYLWSDWRYFLFIAVTAVSTYIAAYDISAIREEKAAKIKTLPKEEKAAYKASVKSRIARREAAYLILNFGILFFCKGLIMQPFCDAFQNSRISFLTLGLPLGISFYTFQSVGYVIDIGRGTAKMQKNPLKMALFISYFPLLIQGPISRYNQLAPQLYAQHSPDGKVISFGLQRILWGYFKKLVIADRIAPAVIALRQPQYGGVGFLLLSICYAIQIYGDFTGGIDIVIGFSQALGINLTENFIRPFFSKNIAEYWRRWHISLGEWMKDYIYYPISTSQTMYKFARYARARFGALGKRLPTYIGFVSTWAATGLWHGLTPNFLLWGMLNCFVLVVSKELQPLYDKFHGRFHLKNKPAYGVFEMLRLFLQMNIIRACDLYPDVRIYGQRVASIVTGPNFRILSDGTLQRLGLSGTDWLILAVGVAVMLAVSILQERKGSVREWLWAKPVCARYAITFLLFIAVLLLGSYGIGYNAGNFIYSQF